MGSMKTHRTPKKPAPQDWHKADIIAALHKAGTSFRKLALARGVHPNGFTNVLRSSRPSWQTVIAEAIGVPPQTIWPTRYHPDGTHKRGLRDDHHPRSQSTDTNGGCNGKAQA